MTRVTPGSLIKESTSLETEPDVFNASLITKRAGVLEGHATVSNGGCTALPRKMFGMYNTRLGKIVLLHHSFQRLKELLELDQFWILDRLCLVQFVAISNNDPIRDTRLENNVDISSAENLCLVIHFRT